MGVYMKNLQVPKTCFDCPLCYDYLCCIVDEDLKAHAYDRHPNCPLIEIDIVRCGECKHWQGNKDEDDLTDECKWITDELPNADDFCSYGERKNDDHI